MTSKWKYGPSELTNIFKRIREGIQGITSLIENNNSKTKREEEAQRTEERKEDNKTPTGGDRHLAPEQTSGSPQDDKIQGEMEDGLPKQEQPEKNQIGENSADQGGVNIVPGSDGNWNENDENKDVNIMEESNNGLRSGKETTPTTVEIPEDNTLSKKK